MRASTFLSKRGTWTSLLWDWLVRTSGLSLAVSGISTGSIWSPVHVLSHFQSGPPLSRHLSTDGQSRHGRTWDSAGSAVSVSDRMPHDEHYLDSRGVEHATTDNTQVLNLDVDDESGYQRCCEWPGSRYPMHHSPAFLVVTRTAGHPLRSPRKTGSCVHTTMACLVIANALQSGPIESRARPACTSVPGGKGF